jgi:hypothetical protein
MKREAPKNEALKRIDPSGLCREVADFFGAGVRGRSGNVPLCRTARSDSAARPTGGAGSGTIRATGTISISGWFSAHRRRPRTISRQSRRMSNAGGGVFNGACDFDTPRPAPPGCGQDRLSGG